MQALGRSARKRFIRKCGYYRCCRIHSVLSLILYRTSGPGSSITVRYPELWNDFLNWNAIDRLGLFIWDGVGLSEFGKVVDVCKNVIITPSAARISTGEIHPNPLPGCSYYHILHFALTRSTSSVIAATFFASPTESFHITTPVPPIRSPAYLLQRLPYSQVSRCLLVDTTRITSSLSAIDGITCSICGHPSPAAQRRYNTPFISSSNFHRSQ